MRKFKGNFREMLRKWGSKPVMALQVVVSYQIAALTMTYIKRVISQEELQIKSFILYSSLHKIT